LNPETDSLEDITEWLMKAELNHSVINASQWYSDTAATTMDTVEVDRALRAKHPALQEAWDQYQALYNLCHVGKEI